MFRHFYLHCDLFVLVRVNIPTEARVTIDRQDSPVVPTIPRPALAIRRAFRTPSAVRLTVTLAAAGCVACL